MDEFQLNEVQPVVHDQKGSQTTLNPLGISCDNCRIWKTKCVRGQQECVRCSKRGVSCTYSGTRKKPKDMDQMQVIAVSNCSYIISISEPNSSRRDTYIVFWLILSLDLKSLMD